MIEVQINTAFNKKVPRAMILLAAEQTLTHQTIPANIDASILVTNSDEVQQLNKSFRDVDAPTDVLAFPSGIALPAKDGDYLGDMIISFEQAALQAIKGGHSVVAEIQLLTVHGLLHLLGHDHYDAEERSAMWQAQSEILKAIKCEILAPTFDE